LSRPSTLGGSLRREGETVGSTDPPGG
jgi:hypothetical protein